MSRGLAQFEKIPSKVFPLKSYGKQQIPNLNAHTVRKIIVKEKFLMNANNYPATDINGMPIVVDAKGKIPTDVLDTSRLIFIDGEVSFSHITSKYEGESLVRENARRAQNNMRAIDKPFTALSLINCSVQVQNQQALSVNEYYARDVLLYKSAKHPEQNFCVNATSKSQSLPKVYQRDAADPNSVKEVFPDGELASGLKVTAVFRVFQPKQPGLHKGLSLDYVIVNEPLRTANFGDGSSALRSAGLNVVSASQEERAAYEARMAERTVAAQAPAQQPLNTAPNNYGQAYPQAQAGYAPAGAPAVSAYPGTAPAAPVAPVAPVAAAPVAPVAPGTVPAPNGGIPTNGYGGITLE